MLKPCPYRWSKGITLECSITEEHGRNSTSLTSKDVCSDCLIPEIIEQVNCKHLLLGKFHLGLQSTTTTGMLSTIIADSGWQANCEAIGFNDRDDYKSKCSESCPALRLVHRDLSNEELISIPNFDATTVTDRELRQAVLVILYKYHTRRPERYPYFDITPEFIAKSLGITIADVVRVVFPMEDEEEVATERYLAATTYFSYIRITNRGIRMIDEEPLFGRLDTAKVRFMVGSINMHNSQLGALNIGDKNQNQGDIMSEASKYDQRGANFPGGFAEANYGKMVESQINYAAQQNLAEAAAEVQQLLIQLEKQGDSKEDAQKQAAHDLAQKAQNNPTVMGKLVEWAKSLGDVAAKTTATEAAKEVFKLALKSSGVQLL